MFLKRLSPSPFFSLTPYSLPSPYYVLIAKCSTSSENLTYPYSHSHPDSRNVSVSVWWDLVTCPVPAGLNEYTVARAIKTAMQSSGSGGPVKITAFSDMLDRARTHPWFFSATGVKLQHVTNVGHLSASESLNETLEDWSLLNPPPADVLVITADERSANILDHLRNRSYNTVLATKESAPYLLTIVADTIWNWDALVGGDNLPSKSVAALLTEEFKSFWTEMETFINGDEGLYIISESHTREDLAIYLKKYGPEDVRPLPFDEVLLIIYIMIYEKSLLVETPFGRNPFKRKSLKKT